MIACPQIFIPFLIAALAHLSFAQEAVVPGDKPPVDAPLLGALPAGAIAFAETTGLEELIGVMSVMVGTVQVQGRE